MLYDPKWEMPTGVVPIEPWRQVLLDAAARIERRGLAKGELLGCNGSLCTMGALQEAARNGFAALKAAEKLRAFLKVQNIPNWNDARLRTKDEVVCALRECANATA
jgi:hypothetical protein